MFSLACEPPRSTRGKDGGEAAAKAGFDEIQFDYVRFPSDGDISQIRYPGKHAQPMGWTIPMFLKYARSRLKPLGVRISTVMPARAASPRGR